LHYDISIHIKFTLALHAQLSLSRDRECKTHVNQRLFFFFCRIYQGKVHVTYNTWPYFRESVWWNYFRVSFWYGKLSNYDFSTFSVYRVA